MTADPNTAFALKGASLAIDRLNAVTATPDPDEDAAAIYASEAVVWIGTAEDALPGGRLGGPALLGLRFARDRVVHQSAKVGQSFPVRMTAVKRLPTGEQVETDFRQPMLFWRQRTDLPSGHPHTDKEAAYDEVCAGRPVMGTLWVAMQVVRRAAQQP